MRDFSSDCYLSPDAFYKHLESFHAQINIIYSLLSAYCGATSYVTPEYIQLVERLGIDYKELVTEFSQILKPNIF